MFAFLFCVYLCHLYHFVGQKHSVLVGLLDHSCLLSQFRNLWPKGRFSMWDCSLDLHLVGKLGVALKGNNELLIPAFHAGFEG